MNWLDRLCEWLAAVAIAAATVIAGVTALWRYTFAYTPSWSEPVMIILVVFSVALAVGPGLRDGSHVSIRFLIDKLPSAWRQRLLRAIHGATFVLGLVILVSGGAYSLDLFEMGFTDYAGIPQWIHAALAAVFGGILAVYAAVSILPSKDSPSEPVNPPDGN